MSPENVGAWILGFLRDEPAIVFFLVLGIGYLIGNLRIKGFYLGSIAGVLFAGLLFGYFGFRMTTAAQMVGFALFIFSVGYQAGPGFVAVLKEDGLKYLTLSIVVAVTGFSIAALWANMLSLPPGMSAGLLAGGLTSSPTLAAAQDAVHAGSIPLFKGWSDDQIIDNIAMGYAVTYIFGLVGLISMIKFLPSILKIDLVKEARDFEASKEESTALPQNVLRRTYRITDPACNDMSLEELRDRYWDKTSVVKVKRDGVFHSVDEEGLESGDIIEVLGPSIYFTEKISKFAEEISSDWKDEERQDTAQIIVSNSDITDQTLADISIHRSFGLFLMEVRRKGKRIKHDAMFQLELEDVLTVTGPNQQIQAMAEYMGELISEGVETDIITLSFGIVIGLIIGSLFVSIGSVSIGLGSAGGLLASGLFIGYKRSIKPTFGQLPEAARWFLMEFGLLLFMAGVGMRAGSGIIETLQHNGLMLVIAGICVTIIPILVGYAVGHKILKISPALIFGAITGAMTSGAALSVVIKEAKSPVPALGYTGTYAFANVLLVIAGSLIMIF